MLFFFFFLGGGGGGGAGFGIRGVGKASSEPWRGMNRLKTQGNRVSVDGSLQVDL